MKFIIIFLFTNSICTFAATCNLAGKEERDGLVGTIGSYKQTIAANTPEECMVAAKKLLGSTLVYPDGVKKFRKMKYNFNDGHYQVKGQISRAN